MIQHIISEKNEVKKSNAPNVEKEFITVKTSLFCFFPKSEGREKIIEPTYIVKIRGVISEFY